MTIIVSYLSVKDSAATPAAGFYAEYSTDAGNNTGWVIFAESSQQAISVPLHENINQFFDSRIIYKVSPGLFVNNNTFFSFEVKARNTLLPNLFENQNVFFNANMYRIPKFAARSGRFNSTQYGSRPAAASISKRQS